MKTALGRFRLVAMLEGVSFLLLLFVAMPLKYMAHMPIYVRYVGWAHGLLFILYFLALAHLYEASQNWTFKKTAWSVLASLLPFGTFVLDARLLKQEAEVRQETH